MSATALGRSARLLTAILVSAERDRIDILASMFRRFQLAAILAGLIAGLFLPCRSAGQKFPLDSTKGLQPHEVTVEAVTYQGRKAVRVMSLPDADATFDIQKSGTGGGIVVLSDASFHNGTIEVDVAGKPHTGAPALARGFVGVGFRLNAHASKYECVYIRPTNGRADDQERRNHSVQYSSVPDYEWLRLRTESPGKYESYVDLVPGEWTRLRIEVSGITMRLYVNNAPQPTLIVHDLKLGDTVGGIALWIGVGTEAYFANLRATE
jgi:hypothetical protein